MRQIKITVAPRERLDKFLSKVVKDLTRAKIKKLINQSLILVNDHPVSPDYKLVRGDLVSIEIPPPAPSQVRPEKIPLKILYEDKDLCVVEKEAGMVVHPTVGHPSGTLVNALLYHFKNIPGVGESLRPGIVHRLDKGTSGLLVVAKTKEALENLKQQFKERRVVKKYLALVSNPVVPGVGKIEKPISRHPVNRRKFTVGGQGKEATTDYKVLQNFADRYSLLEAEPKTGRTHQIRVHLASKGNPIVGDKLYGGKAAPRLFLHANFLEFSHPRTGEKVSFRSELPKGLVKILNKVKSSVVK